MRAPEFWRNRNSVISWALLPAALAYERAARLRSRFIRPERAPVPVVCVGNLVAGGAGKTPVAIAIGRWLRDQGLSVHFLSRGYGGRSHGPLRVDPQHHGAADVGDEPLLLAEHAPSWIARDRPAGARTAAAAGAQILVMDDGFQNSALVKDVSVIVVDAGYGFGNRRLLPAGPLREPIAAGLRRAQAVVLLDGRGGRTAAFTGGGLPMLTARLVPEEDARRFAGKKLFGFAGIGRPEKFFDTLADLGAHIAGTRAFADHHRYSAHDLQEIRAAARSAEAMPVTTAKDAARLDPEQRSGIEVLRVRLEWYDEDALGQLFAGVIGRARSADRL